MLETTGWIAFMCPSNMIAFWRDGFVGWLSHSR